MTSNLRFLLVLCLASLAATARADDVVTEPIVVEPPAEARARDAERALAESPFVTVVRLDERRAEGLSAAEVLAESVGVSIRSLGGLGSFASLSLRGAGAGQTEILVDGVPLSRLASSSIDLGAFDLATFDRVEIYRGGVPIDWAGGAGGAVHLVTAAPEGAAVGRTDVLVGGGSAWRGRVARADRWGAIWTRMVAGFLGAPGDFTFFDDNGTPLNPDDDVTRARANNAFQQVDGVVRAGGRAWSGGLRALSKRQGVPGVATDEAARASLETFRLAGDGERSWTVGESSRVGARGYLLHERQRWRDPLGEVGLSPDDTRYRTWSSGLGAWGERLVGEHQLWRIALDARAERFTQTALVEPDAPTVAGNRLGVAASVSDEIVLGDGEEWALSPALRLDLLFTRGSGDATLGSGAPETRDDVFLSPRLGARWRVTRALALKANAGRYFRPPTVIELLGDRGVVFGNSGLLPERGLTADLGVVVTPGARLHGEATVFVARVDDLIAFLPTSAARLRAGNIGSADLAGIELAGHLRVHPALALTGNYTLLLSRQRSERVSVDGRDLPGRPRHEAYLRADGERTVGPAVLSAWVDLTLVAGNFLDEGNLEEVPPRRLLGLGARVRLPRVALALDVKNLTDARVDDVALPGGGSRPRALADVLGQPLPGRSLLASVELFL